MRHARVCAGVALATLFGTAIVVQTPTPGWAASSAQAPPGGQETRPDPEAEAKPIKVLKGHEQGVWAEVLSLQRNAADGVMTLRVAFVNDSGGEVRNASFPGGGDIAHFQLFDFRSGRKFTVIQASDGQCVCETLNPFSSSGPGRQVMWARFPSPPVSVTRLSLIIPKSEPVDGLPVSSTSD